MNTALNNSLTKEKEFEHAAIYTVTDKPVIVVQATEEYIPIDEFKKVFQEAGRIVKEKKIAKLIFDKTALKVFHQPSMEWYFVEWKDQMATLGLRDHVKILPDDIVFKTSVKIGRDQLNKKYPDATFNKLSIIYHDTLKEALDSK